MKKREQGVLTVEASIVLTLCILFILFLFSFARVYNAQSVVSHAVLQSSDAVALESYVRESVLTGDEAQVTELANRYVGSTTSISADSFTSLRAADVPKIAREKFVYAVGKNEADADEKLKKLGVKGGLSGVDFSASKMDLGNDDVIVCAKYTIKMQFPVFGMSEISVTKAAKSKTFGDILFGLSVVPEDPIMGTASGGGSYKYGTEVEISATPNYGYKFKKWKDGSTANPRKVTVTGEKTYVSVFEPSEFGVTLVASPADGGSTMAAGKSSSGGTYKYLDTANITASAKAGYHFTKWSIYKHKDKKTTTVTTPTTSLNIDQSYTCTASFARNSYTVNAKCSGGPSNSYAQIVVGSKKNQSIKALYKSSFKLTAASVPNYKFLGWKIEGASNYFSTSATVNLTVPAQNITYVACYRSTIKTVRFYNPNGTIFATRTVNEGHSLGGNMPIGNPYNTGYRFNGWDGFSSSTLVWSDTNVYPTWKKCTYHKWGHCGVRHPKNKNMSITNTHKYEAHWTDWGSCIRCVYCQKLSSRNVLCGTHWDKWKQKGWGSYSTYCGPNDCGSYNQVG